MDETMKTLLLICGCVIIAMAGLIAFDFWRFTRKRKEVKSDAGGFFFIKGKKTMYRMPSGAIKEISSRVEDLSPGSPFMRMMLAATERAHGEHLKDRAKMNKKSLANIRSALAEENLADKLRKDKKRK